jgi:GAF domain-containing protein
LTPVATHGEPPKLLDQFQRKLGRGPCFDAAKTQHPVLIEDTSSEQRWPTLIELARSLEVASMLCVPLRADDQRLGALSIYSEVVNAFTAHHVQLTSLFATHAALALADAQRIENLTTALNNRDLIGQAKGILMERLHLTSQAAFDRLALASQALNQKLSVVAQHLVDTGELPAPLTKV